MPPRFQIALMMMGVGLAPVTPTSAQPIFRGDPASWQWQGSIDNGSNWLGNRLNIDSSITSVRIRAVASFPPPFDNAYFGYVACDPYVQGLNGAGATDTITSIGPGQLPPNSQDLSVRRFGNLLKIDDAFDTQPPGLGSWWMQRSQSPNNGTSPTPLFFNPVTLLEFTLVLDGSQGDRLVTAAWTTDTAFGYRPFCVTNVWGIDHRFQQWRHPMTEEQLTIRVIPAPASTPLLVLSSIVAASRRRRPHCLRQRTTSRLLSARLDAPDS